VRYGIRSRSLRGAVAFAGGLVLFAPGCATKGARTRAEQQGVEAAERASGWHLVRSPAGARPEAIGSHRAGCLAGGVALPPAGRGYLLMRPSLGRAFGHPALIEFVERIGRRMADAGAGLLLIGDLSQPRGGPMPGGDASHSRGLDVDLWLWIPSRDAAQRVDVERALPRPVVRDGRLDPAVWTPDHEQLLRWVAESDEVERILVDPAVKQSLCAGHGGAPWLRKLRPWWGHDRHVHVRLACPAGDRQCIAQEPPPPGTGCDALDWWRTEEATHEPPRADPPPQPSRCAELLAEPDPKGRESVER
jgi:penicillin-insensitive murein DD-endopeptidase